MEFSCFVLKWMWKSKHEPVCENVWICIYKIVLADTTGRVFLPKVFSINIISFRFLLILYLRVRLVISCLFLLSVLKTAKSSERIKCFILIIVRQYHPNTCASDLSTYTVKAIIYTAVPPRSKRHSCRLEYSRYGLSDVSKHTSSL